MELRCTPGHRIFTANRGYVEAKDLTADDEVKVLDLPGSGRQRRSRPPRLGRPGRLPPEGRPRRSAAPSRRVDAGVRPLPRVAHRRRQHLGFDDQHDLRQCRGPRRDPPAPRRARRVDQRRPPAEGLRAGQRNGPVAAGAPAVQAFPRGLGVRSVDGPGEVGSLVDRAGAGLGRGRRSSRASSTPTAAWWSNRDKGSLRRPRIDVAGAAAGRPDACSPPSASQPHLQDSRCRARRVVQLHGQGRRAAYLRPRAMYDLRITSGSIAGFAQHIGFSPQPQAGAAARDRCSRVRRASTTSVARLGWSSGPTRASSSPTTCPSRGTTPTSSTGSSSGTAASTCTSTTRRAIWPSINLLKFLRRGRHLRHRRLQGHGRGRLHRPGDPGRQRRLPDGEDRRELAPLPPARHRLRQPRRPAHGPGPSLRLGRGSGLGGGHHRAA